MAAKIVLIKDDLTKFIALLPLKIAVLVLAYLHCPDEMYNRGWTQNITVF